MVMNPHGRKYARPQTNKRFCPFFGAVNSCPPFPPASLLPRCRSSPCVAAYLTRSLSKLLRQCRRYCHGAESSESQNAGGRRWLDDFFGQLQVWKKTLPLPPPKKNLETKSFSRFFVFFWGGERKRTAQTVCFFRNFVSFKHFHPKTTVPFWVFGMSRWKYTRILFVPLVD